MLEESGILDEGNGEDDEYMEVDDVVVMAQSDGSASVPSASVSDKELMLLLLLLLLLLPLLLLLLSPPPLLPLALRVLQL